MSLVEFNPALLPTLKDRVVVLTGGAMGVGRAAVKQFHAAGAKIVFGDIDDTLGESLVSELGTERVRYVHCDTSLYADQLRLFRTAVEAFSTTGGVDIVVANAGIGIHKDPFLPDADVTVEPPMKEVDVNLRGSIFTTRIGVHYLRQNGGGDLVLVSSIAGFKESGGLTIYTATKHGVIGIQRGLHVNVIKENIRINTICPWMTKTRLVRGIEEGWYERGLPTNEPEDVARAILTCATANRGDGNVRHPGAVSPFAGKILWIGGGKAYEIEDRIQALEPEWLGKENSAVLAKGQEYLASEGTSWDTDRKK
ncbi:hypothetical protein VTN31DRAFT_4640 [Thermomyces dupontii]|uniref:uncharacterized protein n=1 Tax=Talaromyces thermophilus TaxID=28565 RepID=UPI003744AD34